MRAAIIILSDPKNGEDALGRVFNALATAYDFQQSRDDVTILFQGAGTRWPAELTKSDHSLHGLFQKVRDKVAGVSSGCADAFGAAESAKTAGCELVTGNAVPGTSGLPSLRALVQEGYTLLSF